MIILRTFFKVYGLAGLRVGYLFADKKYADYLNRVRGPFNVSRMGQIAAVAALNDEDHIKETVRVNEEGKAYLYEEFTKMDLPFVKTEANFIFVDIKQDCKKAFVEMLKRGVIVRTGDIFGYPTFFRVTIGTMEENKRFIAVLKEVLQA